MIRSILKPARDLKKLALKLATDGPVKTLPTSRKLQIQFGGHFIARTTTGSVPGTPPFDAQRSVDGERGIEIVRPLPVSSDGLDLEIHNKVIGVYDKGGAMILEAEQELVDAKTNTVYVKMTSTAFGIGQGGYP